MDNYYQFYDEHKNNTNYNNNIFRPPTQKISKIKVVVRKRPANEREIIQNDIDIINLSGTDTIIVKELKNKVDLTKYIEEHHFTFDKAYDENSTNHQIYEEIVKPMIKAAFNRTKITCFAYGQTGSGKTYTMMGNNHNENDKSPQVPGLYLLSAVDVFKYLSSDSYSNLEIWVSFYEIYCNKLFDLLNNKNILQAREDGKGNICIAGLMERNIKNLKELMMIIDFGLNGRTTGVTGANLDSSRSHAILQIAIKTKEGNPYGKISFIDLAGSERAVDTIDTNKQTKIDGAEINKSLLALKECIRALDQEKRHKPFRGSKLTLVLRDSFIGNCLTLMIANISPCLSCSEHTLNTLRYADRVKELRKSKHERDSTLNNKNKKDPNEILADLLMMPRQHNKSVKYNVDLKKSNSGSNGNILNNNLMNHNYNYNKIKNNNFILDNNNNEDNNRKNDVMKIDEIIKNEKIPSKNDLRKKSVNNNNNYNLNNNNNNNFSKYNNNNNHNNNYNNNNYNNNNYNNNKNNYNNFEINLSNDKYFDNLKNNKNIKNFNNEITYINNDYNDTSTDKYISKYKNVVIKSDEDYQKLSNIHEDLISKILKEEDSFITMHKSHIDEMVENIKKEMKFVNEVDRPGSDIDEYTAGLDKLLLKEIEKIQNIRNRLTKFRIMLKDEECLSNKFDDDLSDNNNSKNNNVFSINLLPEDFINK